MDEQSANPPKPKKPDGKSLVDEGQRWLTRIAQSEKRDDPWRKDAEAAEKAYSCDGAGKEGRLYDFNILHSNVETMVPATYNSTPIPDIRRRYVIADAIPEGDPNDPMAAQQQQMAEQQDKDAKDFGLMIERAISHQIDDNRLDTEIESNARDAYLAGRGVVRVKFDADGIDQEQPTNERIEFEAISWRDYREGPATRWGNVPWIAFRHRVPREVAELKHIDPELYGSQGSDDIALQTAEKNQDEIEFWEIWCEYDRKVKYVQTGNVKIMKVMDDPMGLPGFYPIPQPIQPIELTGKRTPVCPFSVYKKLADELDLCTRRINAIMKGLKVRGIAIGDALVLKQLMEADDNEVVVASGTMEQFAAMGGLEKAIAWWPIETAAAVLKELYVQREATKQAIYEVTGISDIIRGQGNAQTATAQQIKTQWGALRIQRLQRLIERQVRDIFGMMADIIVRMFSPQTLQEMTGIQITPGIMQMIQQGKVSRSYRIDVESDSTVRADLTRQKQDMTEFLSGTAQFISAMGPMVQVMPEMAEPMAVIYSSFARVFNLGKQASDVLESIPKLAKQKEQQPPQDPEMMKIQAEMQAKQAELQIKQQEAQLNIQIKQKELEIKQAEGDMKIQLEQQKLELERQKMGLEQMRMVMEQKREEQRLQMEGQAAQQDMHLKQDEMLMKADHEERRMDMEEAQASDAGRREEKKMKLERAPRQGPSGEI